MTNLALEVQPREVTGKKVKTLRLQGLIPATVYGKGVEPQNVQVDGRTFQTVYKQAGRSALVELKVPGKAIQSVFIHAIQRHPVTRAILHADFHVVDLKTELNVTVPVTTVGESPLVARGDALINVALSTVEIHALPANIPQHIEADVSVLDSMEKSIHIKDLPQGNYSVLGNPETVVISLTPAGSYKGDSEVAAPSEPELIRKSRGDE